MLRLALLQTRPGSRDVAGNLARLDARAAEAAEAGADLLITPEMYLTGYDIGPGQVRALAQPATGPAADAVAAIARTHRIGVLYGYPEADGEQVFNSVALFGPDGSRRAGYRKTHLFGELDRAQFSASDLGPAVVEFGGWRVGMLICYDVEFPENVRRLAIGGAELVLVPTANMLPYDIVPQTVVPARAYENGVYLAYANFVGTEGDLHYDGLSCVIAPDGTDLARAGRDEQLLLADLDPARPARARREAPYLVDRRPEIYG